MEFNFKTTNPKGECNPPKKRLLLMRKVGTTSLASECWGLQGIQEHGTTCLRWARVSEVLHDLLHRTPRTRRFYPHPYPSEQFSVKWIRTRKWSYYAGLSAAQNSMQSNQQGIVTRGLSEHLEWFFWNRSSLCYGILPECTFEDSNLERRDLPLKKIILNINLPGQNPREKG